MAETSLIIMATIAMYAANRIMSRTNRDDIYAAIIAIPFMIVSLVCFAAFVGLSVDRMLGN